MEPKVVKEKLNSESPTIYDIDPNEISNPYEETSTLQFYYKESKTWLEKIFQELKQIRRAESSNKHINKIEKEKILRKFVLYYQKLFNNLNRLAMKLRSENACDVLNKTNIIKSLHIAIIETFNYVSVEGRKDPKAFLNNKFYDPIRFRLFEFPEKLIKLFSAVHNESMLADLHFLSAEFHRLEIRTKKSVAFFMAKKHYEETLKLLERCEGNFATCEKVVLGKTLLIADTEGTDRACLFLFESFLLYKKSVFKTELLKYLSFY